MNPISLNLFVILSIVVLVGCQPKWSETQKGDVVLVCNEGGQTLGYSIKSGVMILTVDGFGFKDLNQNGKLDTYEDWRLDANERAADLAAKMSIAQIAGLMLYSGHQLIPGGGFFGITTYGGKPFDESGSKPSDLTDQQIAFLTDDNLRHVLVTRVQSPEVAAIWNNNAQSLVEGIGHGIPVNNSSDPRHGTVSDAEYNMGGGGNISMWPGSLGLAATFDPTIVRRFGEIASIEYRALGFTTALSPQIDLATEPRWNRVRGTFGENPHLSADMARAYVDGFQSSGTSGWGNESVNAMVKHWPGGGPGEGGRDAHFGYGTYAVYPGNNLAGQLKPFTEGAFKLVGGTGTASALMPYYTISYKQGNENENVANAYSSLLIKDLLRGEYGYDGVICTDWIVTGDVASIDEFKGKPWGTEEWSVAERHYRIIMAGGDQFGGSNVAGSVMEAYNIGVEEHGEEFMRERFETSAIRLLKNIFRTGLFENPYLDVESSKETVGNPEFMTAGFEAQLKSIVLLKNQGNILPMDKSKTVYIPKRFTPEHRGFFGFGNLIPEKLEFPTNLELVQKYFDVTDNPAEADFALVFIESPESGVGYSKENLESGGNGYVPISLQYLPYKAEFARDPSIAGGSPFENFTNRSYKEHSVKTSNSKDLKLVIDTKKKMGNKPVVVLLKMANPTVMAEFEKYAQAILVNFDVQHQSIFEILAGNTEPSALLPLQMPANMRTVEEQNEDVPQDMTCFIDSEGNTYDFGFGLNWSGIINDERTTTYLKK